MAETDAGTTAGTGGSGSAAGTGAEDIRRQIRDVLNQDIVPLLSRVLPGVLKQALPSLLEPAIGAQLEKMANDAAAQTETGAGAQTEAGDSALDGKVTLKALQEKLQAMEKQGSAREKALRDEFGQKLREADEKRAQAEAGAKDMQARVRVREGLAKHLPPDLLDVVMDSFYDVKKRFELGDDGQPVVKFKRGSGEATYEEKKALTEGIEEMLKGDLKPYLPAQNRNLPPSHVPARGQTWQPPKQPDGQPQRPFNPLLAEVGKGIAEHHPEFGQAVMNAAFTPPPGQNGQK